MAQVHRDVRPCLVIGSGGHAKVLIDCLLQLDRRIAGCLDTKPSRHGLSVLTTIVLGDDSLLADYPPDSILLVNGIGSTESTGERRQIHERFSSTGYTFATVVHPAATLGRGVSLAEGAQIMAGAILQADVRIGLGAIVNTGASIDHDCVVGDHAHVAPGCVISGGVHVGDGAHIGTGATVIQGVRIGRGCLVGAGALVIRDVPDGARVMGSPAEGRQ